MENQTQSLCRPREILAGVFFGLSRSFRNLNYRNLSTPALPPLTQPRSRAYHTMSRKLQETEVYLSRRRSDSSEKKKYTFTLFSATSAFFASLRAILSSHKSA